jgi:hypothetical protein
LEAAIHGGLTRIYTVVYYEDKIYFKEYGMWGKVFYKIMVYSFFCFGISLIGCISVKDGPNAGTEILEGTWENNNFTLVVKGNYYLSFYYKYGALRLTGLFTLRL